MRTKTYLFATVTITTLLAVGATGWAAPIITDSSDLPPEGVYVSPDEFHAYAAAGIVLDDPSHIPILDRVDREPDGDDEIEGFDSIFTAIEIGQGLGPIALSGPVRVRTSDKAVRDTGTFDTEMISMQLTGIHPFVGPILVREDENRASTGQTTIEDIGGGQFRIDSFFDVFTELSIDSGQTWIPSDSSTRMTLLPEPGTMSLLVLGGLALLRRRSR